MVFCCTTKCTKWPQLVTMRLHYTPPQRVIYYYNQHHPLGATLRSSKRRKWIKRGVWLCCRQNLIFSKETRWIPSRSSIWTNETTFHHVLRCLSLLWALKLPHGGNIDNGSKKAKWKKNQQSKSSTNPSLPTFFPICNTYIQQHNMTQILTPTSFL